MRWRIFRLKWTKFRLGLRPRPRWGAYNAPQTPSWIWGPLCGRGRGSTGEEEGKGVGKGREGEVEGREREGPKITVEPGPLRALLRHCHTDWPMASVMLLERQIQQMSVYSLSHTHVRFWRRVVWRGSWERRGLPVTQSHSEFLCRRMTSARRDRHLAPIYFRWRRATQAGSLPVSPPPLYIRTRQTKRTSSVNERTPDYPDYIEVELRELSYDSTSIRLHFGRNISINQSIDRLIDQKFTSKINCP